jgi:L-lactate dehydrogenase (cytochrome)
MLPDGCYIGDLDVNTVDQLGSSKAAAPKPSPSKENQVPHLSLCVTANDFEAPAKAVLANKAWIYISSSANSGLSMKANIDDWSRINFRPRVLASVSEVDTRRSILGHVAQLPFFIPPMGSMGSANPGAEPLMVRAAVQKGVHMTLSTASTKTAEDVMASYEAEHALLDGNSPSRLFFQLYVSVDHDRTRGLLQRVKKAGFKGLWWTVDAPVLGKRLADRRLQAEEAFEAGFEELAQMRNKENPFAPAAGGRPVPGSLDPGMSWDYLKWIRQEWDGPIVIKGIQTAADAKLAVEYGCDGIVLSNHGGRQIHTAPSSLMTLLEIRIQYPEILGKIEIYLDGGLRDGSDILKAICLSATAVGVGRPFLYALAAYGAAGVERCTDSEFSSCAPNGVGDETG